MNINVIPYAAASRPELTENKTVVVIDVLRATSVMLTALSNGAREIVPAISPEEAIQKSFLYDVEEVLLGGERNATKIEGFHMGNSPLEYTTENVSDKTIIITTTNGTKALNSCLNAEKVFIGAFLNVAAVIEKIKDEDDIVLFCSGTNNNFSLDDGICAAMIIDGLIKIKDVKLTDFAQLLLTTFQTNPNNLVLLLQDCYHLNLLRQKGFEKDVTFCLQNSLYNIVPQMNLINKSIQ
jgi:2-phosphosulfolactate phosphatase